MSTIILAFKKAFSLRLNTVLEGKGLDAKTLSEKTGLPVSTIYAYLKGEITPKAEAIAALHPIFTWDEVAFLLSGKYPNNIEVKDNAEREFVKRMLLVSPQGRAGLLRFLSDALGHEKK